MAGGVVGLTSATKTTLSIHTNPNVFFKELGLFSRIDHPLDEKILKNFLGLFEMF